MEWNLEGLVVSGQYMGSIPVKGTVRLSRVKYGGEVSHHIDLEKPVVVYGAVRESVILEHKYVEQVSE